LKSFLKIEKSLGPASPDLNPIEFVWGSMKQYLRNMWKSRNLEQLKTGILVKANSSSLPQIYCSPPKSNSESA